MICGLKGFNGQIELYEDKVVISHHGVYAAMAGLHKGQDISIPFGQIERIQFKRGGMEQGFIQFTVIGNEKICNNLQDITHDENSITFGYPKNSEAEQFKYSLSKLVGDIPANIIENIKDIQKLNPTFHNETIVPSNSNKSINTLEEFREKFIERKKTANPKIFDRDVKNKPLTVAFNGTGNQLSENANVIGTKSEAYNAPHTEYPNQDIPYCSKCHSTSIMANPRGYSYGAAFGGIMLFSLIGLIGGPVGSGIGVIIGILSGFSGSKKVKLVCLKCGHKFYPGKK
jgi:hypothetical protein